MLSVLVWWTVLAGYFMPDFTVHLPGTSVAAGGAVPVVLLQKITGWASERRALPIESATVEFEGQAYPLVQSMSADEGGRTVFQAFVPVALEQAPGMRPIRVRIRRDAGDLVLERSLRIIRSITADDGSLRPIEVSVEVFAGIQQLTERDGHEQGEIERLAHTVTGLARVAGPLWLPLADKTLTSDFGEERVFNGKTRSRHQGVDLAGFTGESVTAAAAGRVELAKEFLTTGKTVMIDHGGGLHSLYGHLNAFAVSEGVEVGAGELLGQVGMTGRASGPHLHWGLLAHGKYIDPFSFPIRSARDGLPIESWEKRWEELCAYDLGRDGMVWCRWLKHEDGSWISAKAEILELISLLAPEIRKVARLYEVDPRAIAGVILAENSLNLNLSDEIQDFLVRNRILQTPQLLGRAFTIGLGQVHLGTAQRVEELAARMEQRTVRQAREISRVLLTTHGTLNYIGAILRTSQDIYRESGINVAGQPEILATLYNLGKPEQHAIESRKSGRTPRLNYFGFFVSMQLARIENALKVDRSTASFSAR